MQRVRMLALSTLSDFRTVLSANGVSAQTVKGLIGAWTTVSVTVEQGDKKSSPLAPIQEAPRSMTLPAALRP